MELTKSLKRLKMSVFKEKRKRNKKNDANILFEANYYNTNRL